MEVADIFVVNKADRDGAHALMADMRFSVHLHYTSGAGAKDVDWEVPVLAAQAANDVGIDALLADVRKHRAALEQAGALEKRRQARRRAELEALLVEEFTAQVTARVQTDPGSRARSPRCPPARSIPTRAVAADPVARPSRGLDTAFEPTHAYQPDRRPERRSLMLPSQHWYGIVPGWLIFYAMIAVARRAVRAAGLVFLVRLLLKGKPMPRWDHVPDARRPRARLRVRPGPAHRRRLLAGAHARDHLLGLHGPHPRHHRVLRPRASRSRSSCRSCPTRRATWSSRTSSASLVIAAVGLRASSGGSSRGRAPHPVAPRAWSSCCLIFGLMVTDLRGRRRAASCSPRRRTTTGRSRAAPSPAARRALPRARSRWSSTRRGGCTPRPAPGLPGAGCRTRSICTSWPRRSTCSSPRSSRRGSSARMDLENAETFGVGRAHRPHLEGSLRHLQLHRVRPLHLALPGQHERQGARPEAADPAPAGAPARGGSGARWRQPGANGRRRTPRRWCGDVIHDNVLWACTTCRWCVDACPVFIEHVPKIVGHAALAGAHRVALPRRAAAGVPQPRDQRQPVADVLADARGLGRGPRACAR